jgi:translation initiation factor IF-3
MDFGKYVYEEQKKHSHAKTTASKIKEIELTARIEPHDFNTKLRHAEEFLDHGNKVKIRLKFRGREMAHTEIGFGVMKRAVADLIGMGHPDAEPKLIGRNIHVMLTPLPINKRKPKFHVPNEHSKEADASGGADDADEPEAKSHSGS